MKVIGWIILIGAGLLAVFYFLNKKVIAAETAITEKLNSVGSLTGGLVTALGAGVKALAGGLSAKAGTAATVGTAAAKFVGPLKPTVAAGAAASTVGGGWFPAGAGISTAGVVGVLATGAVVLNSIFHFLFPSGGELSPYDEAKWQEAKKAGTLKTTISRSQLRRPS